MTGTRGALPILMTTQRKIITDTLDVSIEVRAPRAGELGWWVQEDSTAEDMLAEVIRERDITGSGLLGYGFKVSTDYYTLPDNEFDSCGGRCITVLVRLVESKASAAECPVCGGIEEGNTCCP